MTKPGTELSQKDYGSSVSDQQWEHDEQAEEYGLLDATVWVGSDCSPISHQEIAGRILDDEWAAKLYKLLEAGRLVATGIVPSTQIREPIPKEVWERASRSEDCVDGHQIEFITDDCRDQYTGQLTLFGSVGPNWTGITIEGPLLREVFPAAPMATAGHEKKAAAELAAHLRDIPDIRKKDAADILRRAGYELSVRGFNERVWPEARALAGLTRQAAPGRKSQQ